VPTLHPPSPTPAAPPPSSSTPATTRLVFAILELYQSVLPALHTERGLALISAMVVDLAALDNQ